MDDKKKNPPETEDIEGDIEIGEPLIKNNGIRRADILNKPSRKFSLKKPHVKPSPMINKLDLTLAKLQNETQTQPNIRQDEFTYLNKTLLEPSVLMKSLNNLSKVKAKTPRYLDDESLFQASGELKLNVAPLGPSSQNTQTTLHDISATIATGSGATVDPYLRNRPRIKIPKQVWLSLPFVLLFTWGLLLLCYGYDVLTLHWNNEEGLPPGGRYTLMQLIWTLLNPSPDQSRNLMEGVTNTLVFIFGLMISIIGIVLQFASERITGHVTSLFFKDKIVMSALGYILLSNSFAMWVFLGVGDFHYPRGGIVLSVVLLSGELIFLFPFLAYLFHFLDPESVVTSIMTTGLNAIVQTINFPEQPCEKNQEACTLAVEYLMDGAFSGLRKRNTNVTSEIVDALCSYIMHYAHMKRKIPAYWFEIPLWIRQSPDFLILNDESIDELTERQLWIEWKVMRQYQSLFGEALKRNKELCYHICINTRILGECASGFGHYHTLDLCIKFFNTYLRASINANDIRVVYNSLFQYRKLGEFLIRFIKGRNRHLEIRLIKIAKFLRYYAFTVQMKNLFFLVETIAQDIRVLCEVSSRVSTNQNNDRKLLEIFLSLTDIAGGSGSLRGVLKAIIILATTYMIEGHSEHARIVFQRIVDIDPDTLYSVAKELYMSTTREFWEVSERGSNFSYVDPEHRAKLGSFFEQFSWYAEKENQAAFWETPQGKSLKIQQELSDFSAEDAASQIEMAHDPRLRALQRVKRNRAFSDFGKIETSGTKGNTSINRVIRVRFNSLNQGGSSNNISSTGNEKDPSPTNDQ